VFVKPISIESNRSSGSRAARRQAPTARSAPRPSPALSRGTDLMPDIPCRAVVFSITPACAAAGHTLKSPAPRSRSLLARSRYALADAIARNPVHIAIEPALQIHA
jgi:hypothetical protein